MVGRERRRASSHALCPPCVCARRLEAHVAPLTLAPNCIEYLDRKHEAVQTLASAPGDEVDVRALAAVPKHFAPLVALLRSVERLRVEAAVPFQERDGFCSLGLFASVRTLELRHCRRTKVVGLRELRRQLRDLVVIESVSEAREVLQPLLLEVNRLHEVALADPLQLGQGGG